MHSSEEVTAAGVAELGRGQWDPSGCSVGLAVSVWSCPGKDRHNPSFLLHSREIGWRGNTLPPTSLPPQEAHGELRKDPDALRRGCAQRFVRGSCYALNFLLFFDLGFYEEP